MFYAIISQDNENSLEKRLSVRAEHIARLKALEDEGRLLIAGPHPNIDSEDPGPAGFSGSLIVAEFKSLEEIKRKWKKDVIFNPKIKKPLRNKLLQGWRQAIRKTLA